MKDGFRVLYLTDINIFLDTNIKETFPLENVGRLYCFYRLGGTCCNDEKRDIRREKLVKSILLCPVRPYWA